MESENSKDKIKSRSVSVSSNESKEKEKKDEKNNDKLKEKEKEKKKTKYGSGDEIPSRLKRLSRATSLSHLKDTLNKIGIKKNKTPTKEIKSVDDINNNNSPRVKDTVYSDSENSNSKYISVNSPEKDKLPITSPGTRKRSLSFVDTSNLDIENTDPNKSMKMEIDDNKKVRNEMDGNNQIEEDDADEPLPPVPTDHVPPLPFSLSEDYETGNVKSNSKKSKSKYKKEEDKEKGYSSDDESGSDCSTCSEPMGWTDKKQVFHVDGRRKRANSVHTDSGSDIQLKIVSVSRSGQRRDKDKLTPQSARKFKTRTKRISLTLRPTVSEENPSKRILSPQITAIVQTKPTRGLSLPPPVVKKKVLTGSTGNGKQSLKNSRSVGSVAPDPHTSKTMKSSKSTNSPIKEIKKLNLPAIRAKPTFDQPTQSSLNRSISNEKRHSSNNSPMRTPRNRSSLNNKHGSGGSNGGSNEHNLDLSKINQKLNDLSCQEEHNFPRSGSSTPSSASNSALSSASSSVKWVKPSFNTKEELPTMIGRRLFSHKDLQACMKDEKAAMFFWLFLRSCYHQETFSFWLATEDFRQLSSPSSRKERALEMHDKYFKPGSEYELTVDEELKKKMEVDVAVKEPSPDIFDMIQYEVWQNIVHIFFPRFLKSEYNQLVDLSENSSAALQLSELKRSDTYRKLVNFQKSERIRAMSVAPTEPSEFGIAFGIQRGKCSSEKCECRSYIPTSKDGVCKCGHWPIKHANMGKATILLSEIIAEKDKVLMKLMEPGLKLISALCDHCDAEHIENVSKSIYYIFDYHERTEILLKFAVAREIRTTRDSKQLFREDKMTFRIISAYMNHKSKDWLKSVLGPLIKEMNTSTTSCYEINSDRLEKVKSRKDNLKRLRKTIQHFCKAIFSATDTASSYIRLLCSLVRKEVKSSFPEAETTGVAALVFLRLICPAICSPQRFGLVEETVNPNVTRGLVLTAKVLQNISTNMKFGEEFMKDFDDMIDTYYPQMKKFLLSLAELKPIADSDRKISKQQRDESLDILHTFVSKSTKILQLNL